MCRKKVVKDPVPRFEGELASFQTGRYECIQTLRRCLHGEDDILRLATFATFGNDVEFYLLALKR